MKTFEQKTLINESILKELTEKLKKMNFGSVTIKVNHSRIVQVEMTENRRFDEVLSVASGEGI